MRNDSFGKSAVFVDESSDFCRVFYNYKFNGFKVFEFMEKFDKKVFEDVRFEIW